KSGVISVQVGSPLEHHKILTAFGVGARTGDAGRSARKSEFGSFRRQHKGWTAKTILPLNIAPLNNKIGHHAMERNAIISACPAQAVNSGYRCRGPQDRKS